MKAHIVGGGFAGLAAAALLIRDIKTPGSDITIYEADDKLGGGFFLDGDAEHGYNVPGSIFDKEYRCALNLLETSPLNAIRESMSPRNFSLSIENTRSTT